MSEPCLAYGISGGCSHVEIDPPQAVIAIQGSVGAGGANRPEDVRTIQTALNDIPRANGGADPTLKVDALIGPLTRGAITKFQQSHVRVVDGRVDPNGPTLAAINAERGGGPTGVVAVSSVGAGGKGSPKQAPNTALVAAIVNLVPKVRIAIRAARFHLNSCDRFVTSHGILKPTGPFMAGGKLSLSFLEAAFSLSKLPNPRPSFDNIVRVFRNMDTALNRSFETDPFIAPVLFLPNLMVAMEAKAAAYTSAGGAFISDKTKFSFGEAANRIYLCNNLASEAELDQISVVVHELAHFVSGQPIKVVDQVKKGRMLNDNDRPAFDRLKPEQKVRSAEHYAFFAVRAGTNRLLPPILEL